MITRTLILFSVFVGLLAVAGCGSAASGSQPLALSAHKSDPALINTTPRTEAGLYPQSRPPIADLPVPAGFKIVEATSRSHQTDAQRTVDHTYKGRDSRIQVERFYRRQMPAAGWTWRDSTMADGVHMLHFDKDDHRCAVRISLEPRPLRDAVTVIHIDVRPHHASSQRHVAPMPDSRNLQSLTR
ncbi:MAG: hypothetical protein CMJ49_10990 [Planctomycetaceae bacterium]|nr:hypothetical protein [Planctomycetaceae bacterium]